MLCRFLASMCSVTHVRRQLIRIVRGQFGIYLVTYSDYINSGTTCITAKRNKWMFSTLVGDRKDIWSSY